MAASRVMRDLLGRSRGVNRLGSSSKKVRQRQRGRSASSSGSSGVPASRTSNGRSRSTARTPTLAAAPSAGWNDSRSSSSVSASGRRSFTEPPSLVRRAGAAAGAADAAGVGAASPRRALRSSSVTRAESTNWSSGSVSLANLISTWPNSSAFSSLSDWALTPTVETIVATFEYAALPRSPQVPPGCSTATSTFVAVAGGGAEADAGADLPSRTTTRFIPSITIVARSCSRLSPIERRAAGTSRSSITSSVSSSPRQLEVAEPGRRLGVVVARQRDQARLAAVRRLDRQVGRVAVAQPVARLRGGDVLVRELVRRPLRSRSPGRRTSPSAGSRRRRSRRRSRARGRRRSRGSRSRR